MQLGMIGLGRMGSNMVQRLMLDGHECVVYDVNPEAIRALESKGAVGTDSLDAFIAALEKPRTVWMMVPAALVDNVIENLSTVLDSGDIVVDGGNSFYRDDIRRARSLRQQGIHYVDVGTSGGIFGLERGYCQMISSWLLDLIAHALLIDSSLKELSGRVSDSGEGRWTILAAIEAGVPAPVLSSALYARFDSRTRGEFANRLLSAMRREFGGHLEKS